MKNKIALGTAQFGMNYGINNSKGIVSDKELSDIFDLAKSEEINMLDCAFQYGNSEKRIGSLSKNNFKIVTKCPEIKSEIELLNYFSESIKRLNTNLIYGYLFHSADNIIDYPDSWSYMLKLKKNNKIEKIGYSLYNTIQLDKLLKYNFLPDIIQVPYSLLNRDFEKSFITLRKLGVEIHVRSVFLQGLYFMNPDSLPIKINSLKDPLKKLHIICDENNISIEELALKFVESNKNIDKIVIGVDSKSQLMQNIRIIKNNSLDSKIISLISRIKINNQQLLNPSNWK